MQGTKLIDKATKYAMDAHEGQMRAFTGQPYFIHPVEVAALLGIMGLATEQTYIKALLHDVIEDTDKTYGDILAEFGKEVAKGVDYLSKPENTSGWSDMSRIEKVHAYGKHMENASVEDHTIKLADILVNVPDMVKHAKPKKGLSYVIEKKVMITYLTKGSKMIYDKVSKMLDEQEEVARGKLHEEAKAKGDKA